MPNENRINGLSDIAREIANKSADTFALVMVDGHRTGNVLGNLLERAFGISKNRITKLGPTSSTLQDAINLAQKRDIVITPRAIVSSRSLAFSPASTISKLMLVYVADDSATIRYHLKQGDQFVLTEAGSPRSKSKSSTTLLWEEGVFRPVSVSSRVYTTAVVPTNDRKDWITRAFLNQVEGDGRLKTMMESNSSVPVDLSYEYVPHSGPEFFNIVMEKSGVWIKSLLQESTTKWFTNFVNEGVFRPPHSSEDERVVVFTTVFGSEQL